MKRKNKNKGYINGLGDGFLIGFCLLGVIGTYFCIILYQPRVAYTVEYMIPVVHDDIGLQRLTVEDVEAML